MRFLHLSDLHIGRRLNGFSLLEDQRAVLGQAVNATQCCLRAISMTSPSPRRRPSA